jgi:predicted phosphodiesterase
MERGAGDLLVDPHFAIWQYADLLVVGYNSSHHDDPKQQHHGLIDPRHIASLRDALKTFTFSADQLRLFLVHHHPIQYSDPTPEAPDFSVMINAEQLQELLREFRFDILVHGHKHLPRFTTQSFNGSPDIAILCSGSFSVQIDTRWTGTINNQFHMITVEGRDPEEHLIQGQVTSWTYCYNRGWEPSEKDYGGIPHIEPFGTYIRPAKLLGLLRPILTDRLRVADFVEWKWIISRTPNLKHLRPEIVISVVDSLAPEFGCRRHGDTPEKIILLKDK